MKNAANDTPYIMYCRRVNGYTYTTDFKAWNMKTDKHLRKHLKDYQPPDFGISETRLVFHLQASRTRVISHLKMHRISADKNAELVLDGIELT